VGVGSFNSEEFLTRVGRRLVSEFDDASQAGTPGLIGSAREHPARMSLERLLPGAVGVGSGLVIDSYGSTSKQQDVVVFEQAWCPVFSINDTAEATFYPCEGVIAVGEVKSGLGAKELEDAFAKIASVKHLRRRAVAERDAHLHQEEVVSFRKFGTSLGMACVKSEEFDQASKATDQIYGFILCGQFSLKVETLFEKAYELWRANPKTETPNLIVSLKDGFISPFDSTPNQISFSPMKGNGFVHCPVPERAMGHLVHTLNDFVRAARTVEIKHFRRYFEAEGAQYAIGASRPL
jgi:hypothetical protein